ncbi:MAG: type II secretion system GspH family protein, partial [Gammaproteobacteria bacterium]|nr:type II secretion system GspH family protein [Gammaproteobacteria bacterium]
MSRFRFKPKNSAGFSLIEILVAMVIAALLLGMILPNINFSSDQQVKDEAFRLLKIIEMVRDKAVIENREYGLAIDETGYEFLVLNDEAIDKPSHWEKIADLPALSRHDFPEEVEINLAVDGNNIFADKEDDVEIFEEEVDIFEEEDEVEKVEP